MKPEAVSDLDARLIPGLHRVRWAAVTVLAIVVTAAIGVFSWMVITQQQRLEASCQFYRLIATLPIAPHPTPGREGILIVLDSRATYTGQGCGTLPPPGPGLRRWSAHYHLKVKP